MLRHARQGPNPVWVLWRACPKNWVKAVIWKISRSHQGKGEERREGGRISMSMYQETGQEGNTVE